MANRIAARIGKIRVHPALGELDPSTYAIDFQEHFAYQNQQAQAHAAGRLTPGEAMIIYRALGEVWTSANDGWKKGTDLATKIGVTLAVAELMGV